MTVPAPEAAPGAPAATAGAAEASVQPPAGTEPPAKPEVDWKAKSREWENRAKANKEAADELAALKESQKTAEEKAAERAAAIEKRAAELESENIRYKAAVTHGISEEYFELLGTGTEDEIMARAELVGTLEDAVSENERLKAELAALKGEEVKKQTPGPVPALKPGALQDPDNKSYPTGWFPQLQPRQESNSSS